MLSALPALTSQPYPSDHFAAATAKSRPRWKSERWFVPLSFVGAREKNRLSQLGFHTFDSKIRGLSGFARRCGDWDRADSDLALESEILEFMRSSEKPESFPSKRELVDGGRMDLVDAILNKRGWLSFGWELDEDDDDEEEEPTVRAINDYGSFDEISDWSSGEEEEEEEEEESESSAMASFRPYDAEYSNSASSSGRSFQSETTESETGIEGILSRLEKERNITFGLSSADIEDLNSSGIKDKDEDWHLKFPSHVTVAGLFKSSKSSSLSPKKAVYDNSGRRLNQNTISKVDGLRDSQKPDTWRAWSNQRAGVSDIKSEDTVLASSETSIGRSMDSGVHGIQRTETVDEPGERDEVGFQKHKEINHSQIRNRLQLLESELSTVLHAVRSSPDEIVLQKDRKSSTVEMQTLTDAWELKQNEIMNAKDKLRSTRAKNAVLEGKMALSLIEAQKIMELKQKRVDDARRALRFLRSTCIVWPNSASEVLLAGSFDGWENKRKMKKSKTGIFSLHLLLYPGKYEIKFIVDGEWRIDPLRPTVYNNGNENNLLIIT